MGIVRWTTSLALGLALYSCSMDPGPQGPPGPPGMMATSGSRLKAKTIKGEDGSAIGTGFLDSKLGVDCVFAEAEDGKLRCLPAATARTTILSDLGGSTLYQLVVYADAECRAQRLAVSDACSPPLKYVKFSDVCGSPSRIAPVTEAQFTSIYLKGAGGANDCVKFDDPSRFQSRFYSIGMPLAPSEFVAGSVTMEP